MSARDVVGPDGSTWQEVSCSGRGALCDDLAQARCPNGYVVSPEPPPRHSRYGSEVTIHCVSPYAAARPARMTARPDAPPPPKSRAPADILVCERVYARFDDARDAWRSDRARVMPTSRSAFLDTCTDLAEPAQLCLHPDYQAAHSAACESILDALSPADRARVDAMFGDAGGERASR